MVIKVAPDLETALNEQARKLGVTAEALALDALRARILCPVIEPRDEWERRLLSIGTDCGASLTDEQLSREHMYD